MKVRNPKEFAGAISKIRSAIGDERCATAVDRTASLVRKWADPDHASLPNIEQAMLLDMAFVEEQKKKPPLLELYAELVTDHSNRQLGQKVQVDILLSALSVQGIVGDLSEAIREAISPDSEAGQGLSPRERSEILVILERLEEVSDSIEDAVEES